MGEETWAIVVPWVTDEEIESFLDAWGADGNEPWLVLQQDVNRDGCGVTKNKGVARAVTQYGAEIVIILDGDCYPLPENEGPQHLVGIAESHVRALEPQPVEIYRPVTFPFSRGTPYAERTILMPTAASMGFWKNVGDYCAVRQLALGPTQPMDFYCGPVADRYFSLCGMNLAFRPAEWQPWCDFIDVPRFDDIWMGWLWQKEAYRRGYCFNLDGPMVWHARQSNVWANLRDEAVYLERNETLWRDIALSGARDYATLRGLLPC